MYADTVVVNLGLSQEIYALNGDGGSNGYATYLAQQGACTSGSAETTCSLTGAYTGLTPGYTSGTYSLVTTYGNADGGIPATSTTQVAADGGNYFVFNAPFPADSTIVLNLDESNGALSAIPIETDGIFNAQTYIIAAIASTCSNLPPGVSCSQGNVGLYTTDSISSHVTGQVSFDVSNSPASNSPVPEPSWLAFGGLIPGAVMVLRRRYPKAV